MRLTSTRIEPFINSIELRLGRARGIGGVARAARRSHLIATSMAGGADWPGATRPAGLRGSISVRLDGVHMEWRWHACMWSVQV